MARPRIFISSTYFDLKSIREELDRFVSTLGYEPVRHESGHISYGKDEAPESYAYREVEFSDILVSIIGSKFGSDASGTEYSISQQELKRAYSLGKQVYIFIDEAVHAEYKFYQSNKQLKEVKYLAVTDTRIYSFIEELYALPHGNPIFSFRTGADLIKILREQWAGLFQRLLTQETRKGQSALTEQLQQSLQTVDQLVKFLQESHSNQKATFQEIIIINHPIFSKLRELTKNKYRLYFSNISELDDWLSNARSYEMVKDNDAKDDREYIWMKQVKNVSRPSSEQHTYQILSIAKSTFDDKGNLKPILQSDWKTDWIMLQTTDERPSRFPDDDDIPW